MDKLQAETAADVLLEHERRRHASRKHRVGWGGSAPSERRLLATCVIAGGSLGSGVFYFAARHASSVILALGAESGAGAGVLVGWAIMLYRRIQTIRSTRGQSARPVDTDLLKH
ncbi:MAG: hypothetical protein ACYCUX_04985 [Metallibacterium sp.]